MTSNHYWLVCKTRPRILNYQIEVKQLIHITQTKKV